MRTIILSFCMLIIIIQRAFAIEYSSEYGSETRHLDLTSQVRCMADAVYGEARGEPLDGMVAVAWVIRNRVDQGFADTPCAVVHQRRSDGGFQFSFLDAGTPKISEPKIMIAAFFISQRVFQGAIDDPTHGATFFHASGIEVPSWMHTLSLIKQGKIGNHLFYKLRSLKRAQLAYRW